MDVNNLPGNSLPEPGRAPQKQINKIVDGTVARRKRSLGSRFKETFVSGQDAKSVGGFVLFDVIIPAVRDLVVQAGEEALHRSFYGDGRSNTRGPRVGQQSRTAYSQVYKSPNSVVGRAAGQQMSQRSRVTHNFDDFLFDTKVEAQEVLQALYELIDQFDVATQSDLLELVGEQPGLTDPKWGWTSLPGAGVSRTRHGSYVLDLPKPEFLG